MNHYKKLFLLSLIIFSLQLVLSPLSAGEKKTPEEYFKGDIILSKKPFPNDFKSDKAFIKYMNKVDTKVFKQKNNSWNIEYMAFLLKPNKSTQCAVTIYDITDPKDEYMVTTFAFYPNSKNEQIMASHLALTDPPFKPNRKYLIQFSEKYGKAPLAETEFVLR